MQRSDRHSVSTTSSNGSGRLSIFDASSQTAFSTPFSSPGSVLTRSSSHNSTAGSSLIFSQRIIISFSKGTSLFRIPLLRIDVCKDADGGIRKLNISSDTGLRESVFTLNFPNSRLPIPHLEQPYTTRSGAAYRISFIEEQTLQTGGNLFQAKPSFAFERWEDCQRFQEALLGQQVVFVGAVAEAKSKGRGEECISQNLRVLRSRGSDGKSIIIFFANSQRRDMRRYISIPVGSVDAVDPGRKSSSPITLRLRGDTEMATSMKTLTLQFIADADHDGFLKVVKR